MLLTTLARKASSLSAHIAAWVEPELRKLIAEETAHLEALREAGVAMDGEAKEEDVAPNGGGLVDAAAPQEAEAKAAVEEGMAASTEAAAVATADAEPAPDVELPDAWNGACPECAACKYECFLSSVACTAEDGTITHLSPMHALGGEALKTLGAEPDAIAASELPISSKRLHVYRSVAWLESLLKRVSARAEAATAWVERAKALLEPDTSTSRRPTLAEAQSALRKGTALQMDDEHMLKLSTLCTTGYALTAKAASLAQVTGGRSRGSCLHSISALNALQRRTRFPSCLRL